MCSINKYILCYTILLGEQIKVDIGLITQRTACLNLAKSLVMVKKDLVIFNWLQSQDNISGTMGSITLLLFHVSKTLLCLLLYEIPSKTGTACYFTKVLKKKILL